MQNPKTVMSYANEEYTSNILRGLGLRDKSIIVSNVGDYDFRVFSLDIRQLYRLLHESYFYITV